MTDPYELVIRLGRRFSADAGDGVFRPVREIRIPFAGGREAAEAAQREVQVFTRRAHDAGGEDYHPVVAGQAGPGYELIPGQSGYTEVVTAVVGEGTLKVSSHFQNIEADGTVIGWQCTGREALLNGNLVMDPLKAQQLSDEAGLPTPLPLRWVNEEERGRS